MIEGHDYTIYSNGPGGRSRMYALLALITAFTAPLVQRGLLALMRHFWGDDWDIAQTALFFGGFTALILFGILVNRFNNYFWRTALGGFMFRLSGLPMPPDLRGHYEGSIDLHSAHEQDGIFQTSYTLQIAQTWEQISLLVTRASQGGGAVRVHSDMASVRVGMMEGVVTLRFVYTFEENLPRRDGIGTMARRFSGAATFDFQKEKQGFKVEGHFFDDIGRSGQIRLTQTRDGNGRHMGMVINQ